MTNESPAGKSDDWKDCRPRHPDDECDPSSIDDLVCRAKGVAAQATYNATYQPAVEQAQKDYDTARKAYRERRHEAALAVQDMKHQIKHLVERIRCLIEQERVVRCLDNAFDEVSQQLDCCEGCYGCCVEDFDYDSTPPTEYRELVRRIEKYQREVGKVRACFESLVGEPAALAKRVVDAKAAIDKVNADLAKDAATVDLKRVYAEARVAQRLLSRIWHGFADSAKFVDCLCRALTSWSTGAEVISILTGARAVEECKRDAAKTWCDALLANPVDEILAGYDRLCPSQKPCKPAPEDDDQNESEPCGDEDEPKDKPRGHPGRQGA